MFVMVSFQFRLKPKELDLKKFEKDFDGKKKKVVHLCHNRNFPMNTWSTFCFPTCGSPKPCRRKHKEPPQHRGVLTFSVFCKILVISSETLL
ncbi:MAG: hypothetical protein J6W73_00590, partial [Verrucomicrobia bacterium]|nr:hypothetical protein [Verrucomicrobiota bacterium]